MNRYAAKRHVDDLAAIGLLRELPGRRDSGPVRDYVVAPEAFFELYDAVRALGEIRPAPEAFAQTVPGVLTRTKATMEIKAPMRPSAPFPYLVVVYGAEIGRAFPLAPLRDGTPHWLMGRDPKSHIALDTDPFASNRHARISRHGSDYVLTDTFSTNGTWINWARLPEGESAPIAHGDIVGIGKSLLVFRFKLE